MILRIEPFLKCVVGWGWGVITFNRHYSHYEWSSVESLTEVNRFKDTNIFVIYLGPNKLIVLFPRFIPTLIVWCRPYTFYWHFHCYSQNVTLVKQKLPYLFWRRKLKHVIFLFGLSSRSDVKYPHKREVLQICTTNQLPRLHTEMVILPLH